LGIEKRIFAGASPAGTSFAGAPPTGASSAGPAALFLGFAGIAFSALHSGVFSAFFAFFAGVDAAGAGMAPSGSGVLAVRRLRFFFLPRDP